MANNDPVIVNVLYNGKQVKVTWVPSADTGVTGYVIQLSYIGQAADAVAYQSGLIGGQQTRFGTLSLRAPLNTDVTYRVVVQAMWDNTPGEASAPVVMPTVLPVLRTAWYDGSVASFFWAPSTQAAQGYELLVYSLDSGLQYTVEIADPMANRGVIPASVITPPLDPAQNWVAAVSALGENQTSARSPDANFPFPLPVLKPISVYYQTGSRINARWNPLPDSNVTGVRLSVTSPQDATDFWIDIPNASASNGILPIPAPLPANQEFAFRLVSLTSTGAGVASPPVRIITTVPTLTEVSYNGTDSVSMVWAGLSNVAITGYTLQVLSLSSGLNFDSDVSGYYSVSGSVPLTAPLDTTQQWVARLIANGPVPAQTGDTPMPVSVPTLTSVRCDGHDVTVEWTAVTPDPGLYVATLLAGGIPVANAQTTGTSATLPVPAGATALTVQVAPRTGIATGGASAAATVIASAPQVSALLTDPVTGVATLSWSPSFPAPSLYLLSFSDGTSATSDTISYVFPTAPPANARLTVGVTARLTAAGVTSTGPVSAVAELATERVVLLEAGFDGIEASAAWTPIPGASGYRISVQQTSGTRSEVASSDVPAGAASAAFAFSPPNAAETYALGVQAKFGNTPTPSTGPLSPLSPLFHSGFFASVAAASSAYPHVYPATSLATVSAAAPGEAIAIYLPQIGGGTPLKDLPLEQGAFNLQANSDPVSRGDYPYMLTFAANSAVWTFTTEPVRAGLLADYVAFLKTAELSRGVVPWGVALLQQVISRYMPQTFQETLYYAFGLTFPSGGVGSAFVDLRPGMVLRVAADPYVAMAESSLLKWASGYVAGPVVDYDVSGFTDTAGNWTVGYDSFIGQLVAGGALTVPPPPNHFQTQQQGGIADAADLYYPGFRTPFYRLFIPTALAGASEPCPTDTPRSFVLAAAPTYNALTTTVNVPRDGNPVAYFRGRAVVRPCVRVVLNGDEITVPVGTTVGNLLERSGRPIPPAPVRLQSLRVERALGPVVLNPQQPLSAAAAYPIRFDWKSQPGYALNWTSLTLPLLAGDRVTFAR